MLSAEEKAAIERREWPVSPFAIDTMFLPVLVGLEQNGCAFDPTGLDVLDQDLTDQMEAAEFGVRAIAGWDVNLNAPHQLAKLLYTQLGLPVLKRSKKTKQPSVDREVLPDTDHPVADLIQQYREAKKLRDTYVRVLPRNAAANGGRAKTTYNNTLVETGRLSSGSKKKYALSFNAQNIPKRSAIGSQLRAHFVAPEGYLLYSIDASQFQLRIAAVDSQDPGMIAAFLSGADYHEQTSRDMFGTPALRQIAKTLNFAMLFGATRDKVRRTILALLGSTADPLLLDTAYDRFFEIRPVLAARIKEVQHLVSRQGYIDDWFGRRNIYPFDPGTPRWAREKVLREAYNFMIQGPEASAMKIASTILHRHCESYNLRARPVLMVHDEIVFEVHQADGAWFERAIVNTECDLNALVRWPIPIKLDFGKGPNWLEAH